MDFNKIKEAAQSYQADMTAFLRAIVKNPGESCDEKAHIDTIAAEMKKLDFDEVIIDPQGNVIGYMGTGDRIIAYDAHIDTVGIGNIDNWTFDPYEGYENETEIGGRGVSDQCGGLVSAVYGAKIMKDMDLIPEGCKIMVVGTVQEEDCDGLCWQYIINEDKIRPEFVVSTEPTDGGIYRGQRGRMEIRIDVKGVSCHGSAPERGDNAIYKMADILQDVRALNENDDADGTEIKGLVKMLNPKYNPDWEEARFLGRGTVTVSQIFYTSPSRCAVADSCAVSLDRRMTFGETWESCLDEIRALPSVKKYGDDVVVSMYNYDRPSYTGCVYEIECYFPTWINMLVRTYAWLGILQDNGIINSFLGLFGIEPIQMIYTNFAVILGMVYNFVPFMILQIYSALDKMDKSYLEAASDLGANRVQSFLRVTFPMSLPGVISGITLVFLPAVSSFFIPKLLGGGQFVLIGNVIETQFLTAGDWGFGSAISLIMAIIIMISLYITRRLDTDPAEAKGGRL